jgi:general secretion pathway protein G
MTGQGSTARCLPPAMPWLAICAATFAVLAVVIWMFVCEAGIAARGRRAKIEQDLRNIVLVAGEVSRDTGKVPESIEAMIDWVNKVNTPPPPGTTICQSYPRDPWGREYIYAITSNGRPLAACLGSDGQAGGEGGAADSVFLDHPGPMGGG